MKEYQINDVEELTAIAKEVIEMFEDVAKGQDAACVLALHGDLGAGKTTFMQVLARELGINEVVTSPTFVVMKKYTTQNEAIKNLIHMDAYRIEDVDEMRPLRFEEELAAKSTIIGIEWAEKIESLLPEHTIHMKFEIEEQRRLITIDEHNG